MNIKDKKVLVLSDHEYLLNAAVKILRAKRLEQNFEIVYACSPGTQLNPSIAKETEAIHIDVKKSASDLIENYNMIISIHCRQILPAELVRGVKCINVHPGYNPYNRGWFPHVFSIINKLPAGATIHEMDEEIDNGPIIAREEVGVYPHDTSETLYNRVLAAELRLLENNMEKILEGDYTAFKPEEKGNINYKSDYEKLKAIDLNEQAGCGSILDRLRALTHGKYKNAYFLTRQNKKIFVSVNMEVEDDTV